MSTLYESKNGRYMTTSGVVRILIILLEVDYIAPATDPTPVGGYPSWPSHQMPTWADNVDPQQNLVDWDIPVGLANGLLTRYYQEASSGNFTVLGDYLLAPDNGGVFHFPSTTGIVSEYDAVNAVNSALGTTLTTAHGYSSVDDFDMWTLEGPGAGPGEPKVSPSTESPRMWDHVMFIWRNAAQNGNGFASQNYLNVLGTLLGNHSNTYSFFGAWDKFPLDIMRHEFAHLLYGGNNFHTAGGGWDDALGHYWIQLSGGWSNLGLYGASLNSWNSWDRQRMGWFAPGQVNEIAARSAWNTAEVDGDLDASVPGDAGIYRLRDFVATGDALRIKLPFTAAADFPEFLWIENHQGRNVNGNPFDRWQFEDANCVDDLSSGLFMYVQIDKDIRQAATSGEIYGGPADHLRPLIASGHFDLRAEPVTSPSLCATWPPSTKPAYERILPNPLTGLADTYYVPVDKNGNGLLPHDDHERFSTEYISGGFWDNLFWAGNIRHGFSTWTNLKVGIGTNPSSASMMSSVGYDFTFGHAKDLDRVYLNGVSVELIQQFSDGSIQVEVRFDDVDVANDARWCAPEIQLNPVATSTGYSLNVTTGNTITLDQGRTATRRNLPITLPDGTKVFTDPTLMRCPVNTWLNLEPGSGFTVDNNSTLRLEAGSRVDVGDGAVLLVKRGGKLELEGNSTLNILPGGKVLIEEDVVDGNHGYLVYHPDARINLESSTSVLEISGMLRIMDNATFAPACIADPSITYGKVRFTSTSNLCTNVLAGVSSRFVMRSNNQARRILDVEQQCLWLPSGLVEFSLIEGTASLWDGSYLVAPVSNGCAVNVIQAKVTSPTATPNAHRGLWLFGQTQTTLQNSVFSNGYRGLYAYNPVLGGDLNMEECIFVNNDVGCQVYGNAVNATSCSFTGNNVFGLLAEQMSTSSSLTSCTATANDIGVYFQGATNVDIYDPAFDANNIGLFLVQARGVIACGSISDNTDAGIEVDYGASVHMDGPYPPTHEGVTVVDNAYSIRCANAWNVYLNNGQNSLRPLVTGIQRSLNGSFICQPYYTQSAFRNNWNGTAGSTLNAADYHIWTACTPSTDVQFIDWWTVDEVTCGQATPPCPEPPCEYPPSHFASCPTCEFIETDSYGTLKLNEASAAAFADAEGTDPANEKAALEGFNDILMADMLSVNASERWLLQYDYDKMKETFGDAFASGEVSAQSPSTVLDQYVLPITEVHDKLIAEAVNEGRYMVRLMTSLDQVSVLRAAGRFDQAIDLLADILVWTATDELDLVGRILCLTTIERDVVNATIDPSEVEQAMEQCVVGDLRVDLIADATADATGSSDDARLTPNPARDVVRIVGVAGLEYSVDFYDVFGKRVLVTEVTGVADVSVADLSSGVYTCTIGYQGKIIATSRLVVGR